MAMTTDPLAAFSAAFARDWKMIMDECFLPPDEQKRRQEARAAEHAKWERKIELAQARNKLQEAQLRFDQATEAIRSAGDC